MQFLPGTVTTESWTWHFSRVLSISASDSSTCTLLHLCHKSSLKWQHVAYISEQLIGFFRHLDRLVINSYGLDIWAELPLWRSVFR